MHIVLAILGSIVTILFYLSMISRSGVSFSGLNPFAWNRRRKWRKRHYADPVFAIKSPMEATAGLMYAVAKSSGDITAEQKSYIKNLFQSEFSLSERQATELLSSCSYLLKGDENRILNNLEKFMAASLDKFSQEQKESAFDMVKKVAHCEKFVSDKQQEFLGKLEPVLVPVRSSGKWE